jgi:hypothetical protein
MQGVDRNVVPRFFDAAPINNWSTPRNWTDPIVEQPYQRPAFADDEAIKALYGIELAKDHHDAFAAALVIFQNNSDALWASNNWCNDPVVIAARDVYKSKVEADGLLLSKEQLAAKLLKFEQEKHPQKPQFYLHESKDRLAALKLYSEVMGWIGKAADVNVSNNFVNNEMKIRFIEAEEKIKEVPAKIIEHEEDDFTPLDLNIKLVG